MSKQRVLIITVGGSDIPLVRSIEQHQADYVCFICSSDSNNIKGSYVMVDKEVPARQPCLNCKWTPGPRDSLVKQTGLSKDNYEIILVNPDNLEDCYLKSLDVIKRVRDKYSGSELRVDYTGGTKTMSVGLAIAAEDCGCFFSIVKGTRLDLEKVRNGTERVTVLRTERVTTQRQLRLAEEMSEDWDYAGAVKVLEHIANRASHEDDDKIQYLLVIARGLTAWDRFDYPEAIRMIETYKRDQQIKRQYNF